MMRLEGRNGMKLSTLPSLIALVLATGLAACTKPNPAVCCLDAADCDEVGIPEVRGCSQGLACVDHQCTVPSCAEAGCGAEAPVCNVTTDICEPCVDSSECMRFAGTPVCGSSGSCVQCLATADCTGTTVCETNSQTCVECLGPTECTVLKPICDNNACRAPQSDDDCPSLAMATDGTCVPEGDVVYLSPIGTDVGSCNRAVPCLTLAFAVSKTTGARSHIVFAPGQYATTEERYDSSDTAAPSLHLHGHGAEVNGPTGGDGSVMSYALSVVIQDLRVKTNVSGSAITLYASPALLERVETAGSYGVDVTTAATLRDYKHTGGAVAIRLSGALTLDRAVIADTQMAIRSDLAGASVQISNALIYGSDDRAIDLDDTGVSGTIVSSTIVTAGTGEYQTTGARAVNCASTAVLLRSTIVWSPNAGAQPSVAGCSLNNVIAGPASVPGGTQVDPMFVNLGGNDYHLAAGSPARDAVDTGPGTDFEGQPRPQGVRFDIGADEALP